MRPFVVPHLRAGMVAVAAFSLACGGPPMVPRTVSLRMTGTPPGATVTIDDEVVGSLQVVVARGVALPPGKHRITVEAPGYFPWDQEVEATAPGPLRLDVQLRAVPD